MVAARTFLAPFLTWFRLLKDSWHSAAASVAATTLVTASAVLAGRELGPAAFGSVGVITAYFGWFQLVGSYPCFSLVPSFLASKNEAEGAKRRGIGTVLMMKLFFSGTASLCAVACMPLLMPGVWRGELRGVALVYAVVFFQSAPRAAIDVVSQSAGWLRIWSVSSTFANALPLVSLLGFLLTSYELNPLGYVALLMSAGVASILFSLGLLVNQVGGIRHLRPRFDLVRPFLAAGRGPWLSVVGGVLSVHGVRTIIATHLPNSDLALYDVAFQLLCWVTGIGMAVSIPALSQWSRMAADGDIRGLRRDLRRRQAATAVVMGTVGLISFAAARPIMLAVYGPEYLEAAPVLRIMAVSLVLGGAGGWYWIAAYALSQPYRLAMPNVSSNVVMVILAYSLIRFTGLGIAGAASAYLIAVALWLVVYEWEIRRAFAAVAAGASARDASCGV